MYHSVIGKKLVSALGRRDGVDYSIREFFDDVFYPLFFANDRFLLNANNSPIDQAYKNQKRQPLTSAVIQKTLETLHLKIATEEPDGSFYMGGPARGKFETTSGQVSNVSFGISEEDVYASWIGASLGATLSGGFSLLLDQDDALLEIYDGWKTYRSYLDQTPTVKAMQINTWNGQWLTQRFSKYPNPVWTPTLDRDNARIETQPWVQAIFSLAYHYRNTSVSNLSAYVYKTGQTNTTVGFIRIDLPRVNFLTDIYEEFFTLPEGLSAGAFENLYETENSFLYGCSHTAIGLRAMTPKGLFKASDLKNIRATENSDNRSKLALQTYQTWIIAMLNDKDLTTKAGNTALALLSLASLDERGKTVYKQRVDRVLEAKTRREFIEALTDVVKDSGDSIELLNEIVTDISSMPMDNVQLFLTLLRFKFAYVSNRKVQ